MLKNADGSFKKGNSGSRQALGYLDHRLIEIALQHSPSGSNNKPFKLGWSDNRLFITLDSIKAQHYLNRKDHASLLALGCALTSVEVAAHAQGFQMQTSLPDFQQEAWMVTIDFVPGKHLSLGSLVEILSQRATYRKSFQPSSVTLELQKELHKLRQDNAGIKLAEANTVFPAFKNYIFKTEAYLWAQPGATKDFLRGLRFFNRARTAEASGIPIIRLGVNWFDQFLLVILSFLPSLPSLLMRLPGVKFIFIASTVKNFNNSHFLLIHLRSIEAKDIVQAGQLAMKAWLNLEEQGYKVQPMSSGSLCLLDAMAGQLPRDTIPEYQRLFNKVGPEILAEQFHLNSQEHPVWLLRFGKPRPE